MYMTRSLSKKNDITGFSYPKLKTQSCSLMQALCNSFAIVRAFRRVKTSPPDPDKKMYVRILRVISETVINR